jgi:hypothetical protein
MASSLPQHQSVRAGDRVRALLVLISVLLVLAAWGLLSDRKGRELAGLPPPTRLELYERTMANLTSICAGTDSRRLEDFCREQAELALRFPECDATCERQVRAILLQPTR